MDKISIINHDELENGDLYKTTTGNTVPDASIVECNQPQTEKSAVYGQNVKSPVKKNDNEAVKNNDQFGNNINNGIYLNGETVKEKSSNNNRGNWTFKMDFLISCLGYAVGLGNIWRFPYMCYRNGGGAFLIPYFTFLFLAGIPLFLIDVGLGQFTSTGPFTCWEYAPLLTGMGYAMVIISSLVTIYYQVIISYALFYFFASMTISLPWSNCDNYWNTEACTSNCSYNSTCNGTGEDKIILPSQEYFNRYVLNLSDDISQVGMIQWKLALCLFGSWILIFICLHKGIKSIGRVAYFTTLFPYVLLIILFVRGLLLDGASDGIKFYIIPDLSKLGNANVWKDAVNQIFFSLSASWGGLITLASYNKFHNNIIRDTLIISLGNCCTSVFAGFVIFSYLGFLAKKMQTDVSTVADKGMGLAFIVYPEAIATMPAAFIWSIVFFFMLFLLGLASQFAAVETIVTGFVDAYPLHLKTKKFSVTLIFCILLFLLGLPLVTRSGPYWLQLMDSYCGGWSILLIAILEVISIGWIYGRTKCSLKTPMRFEKDIEIMIKRPINVWWRLCWQWLTPLILTATLCYSWFDYTRAKYGDKTYPLWADVIGWFMTIASLMFIPGVIIKRIVYERKTQPYHSIKRIVSDLTTPSYKWGPTLSKHRLLVAKNLENGGDFYIDIEKRIKYSDYIPEIKKDKQTEFY